MQPLAVQAAEVVATHMPAEEDEKLAPHHAAIIRSVRSKGIKRGNKEWKDKYDHSNYKQNKARIDEMALRLAQTGQLPIEGKGEEEGPRILQGREKMEGMGKRKRSITARTSHREHTTKGSRVEPNQGWDGGGD